MSDKYKELKTQVVVKLTLLVGACRMPSVKKKQIEESLERFIKELRERDEQDKPKKENHEPRV